MIISTFYAYRDSGDYVYNRNVYNVTGLSNVFAFWLITTVDHHVDHRIELITTDDHAADHDCSGLQRWLSHPPAWTWRLGPPGFRGAHSLGHYLIGLKIWAWEHDTLSERRGQEWITSETISGAEAVVMGLSLRKMREEADRDADERHR